MFKIFSTLMLLSICAFSLDTKALETNGKEGIFLNKYTISSQIPSAFLALVYDLDMVNKTYEDDNGILRKDKIYYTSSHVYKSTYNAEDITKIINPKNDKMDSLFENMTVVKDAKKNVFNVTMKIITPFKNFICESHLNFNQSRNYLTNVFTYTFSDFNMIFTSMVVKVEVEEKNSTTEIKISQIAALKGSTYSKLKSVFAVGEFEKSLMNNIQNFKNETGAIQ